MKVVTYSEVLRNRDGAHENALLDLWAKSWQSAGWDVVIVGPKEARAHPDYEWLKSVFQAQPTVNARDYETACWMRWLAYCGFGEPVVVSDYDVRNRGWEPPRRVPVAAALDPDALSSCVLATPRFLQAIPLLLLGAAGHSTTYINGQPHNSDMYAWKYLSWSCNPPFEIWPVVVPYPQTGALVHYAGAFTGARGLSKTEAWEKD